MLKHGDINKISDYFKLKLDDDESHNVYNLYLDQSWKTNIRYSISISSHGYLYLKLFLPRYLSKIHNLFLVNTSDLIPKILDEIKRDIQQHITVDLESMEIHSVELARQFQTLHQFGAYFPVFNLLKGNRFAVSSHRETSFQWGVKHKKFQIYDKMEQLRSYYRRHIAKYKCKFTRGERHGLDYHRHQNHVAMMDFCKADHNIIRAELKLKSRKVIQKELGIQTFEQLCNTPMSMLEKYYNWIVRYLMLTEELKNVQ